MQEEVRLRPAARQYLALPLFAVAVMVIAFLLSRRVSWLLVVLTVLLMIPQVYGVKLTDTHLIHLRLLGPQQLPWGSINEIEERHTSTSTLVIVHSPISKDRLVTPRQGWLLRDPDFDAKLEVLKRAWVQRRGKNWRPPAK